MKKSATKTISGFGKLCLAASTLMLAGSGHAGIVGPYAADVNTLHLWHMDQGAVPVLDSASNGGTNLVSLLNGAALGSASFTGFGSALNTLDGGQDLIAAANKDALLSPSTANPPANLSFSYADPTTGAFTFEAIVWIGFDPSKNLGTTANGGNNRNTTLEIVSAESSVNGGRIFQFRLLPVGMVPIGTAPTTVPLLTFENVRAVSANQPTIYAAIPTTGPDAIVSNNWYHVAVTYNGSPTTAGNIKFYWTLMDSTRTAANQIAITSAQTTLSGLNPLSSTATPFVVGNEARSRAGNFLGLIDEVRISKSERTAAGMMFAPASATIITPPANQFAATGDTVTLSTVAGGGAPLFYRWLFNGTILPSATNSSLVLSNISTSQAGNYQVIVSNLTSTVTSTAANVRVGGLFADLYNTGLSDSRTLLPGGTIDPHWQLVQSDDPAFPGPSTYVDTTIPGAWLPNGPNSEWLSPGDSVSNGGGLYTYRTSFLLDTVDPANAQLTGNWVSDNPGVDIRLNGVSLGLTNSTALGSFTAFTITNGFLAGSNTLDCVVSNTSAAGFNPTGIRVEARGVGLFLSATSPQLLALPVNVSTQTQQSASFTVTAFGSAPLAYQWFHGATPLSAQTNRTLTLTGLTPIDAGNYTVTVSNGFGSTNATATLTVITPPVLAWLGTSSGDWDTLTPNWLDTGNSTTVAFSPNEDVLFDSRGSGSPTVNLTASLNPNSVVVSTDTDYTFTGAGGITGSVNLTKQGVGTLILDTVNTYNGITKILNGTLQIGNADATGTLGTGPVSNNAALVFNRQTPVTVPNTISGSGSITLVGGGSVVLTGTNNYTGPTVINAGSLSARSSTALGTPGSGTTVALGAQLYLDFNIDIPAEPLALNGVGLAGDGALRKGGSGTSAFGGSVTLASNAGIKVDGNATLNLTNATGISSANFDLGLAADTGGRGVVFGPVNLGSGAVSEFGSGTWVFAGTSNFWTGPTTISGGTLQIGDGGDNGSIGSGTIQNDAALTFFSSRFLTISNSINGAGTVNQNGSGTLVLAGINSYSGITHINGTGALRPVDNQSLGSGTVAIGATQTDASRLELTGNITLINPITIFPRAFGVANNPSDIVNVSGTNILNPPASIAIGGGGNLLALESASGLLILSNGITAGGVGRVLVLKGAGAGQIYGALDQTGANNQLIYKLDAGTWTLYGPCSPGAPATISNGTLVVNGSLSTSPVTVAGGVLSGNGVILSSVVVNAGAALAPGNALGTLTISNTLALQPGSFTTVEINKTLGTSDTVIGVTSLTYGGTLMVSNLSGTLVAGNSFKLFDAASYAGSFAGIIPATPGSGLTWNTSTLAVDGTLRVASAASPPTITGSFVSGGNLVLTGSGGVSGGSYLVLSSTNVAAPLATWKVVSTNSFDNSGQFSVTNAIAPTVPKNFFRLQAQ